MEVKSKQSANDVDVNVAQSESVGNAIKHAVDMKSLFELYAYRVISHELFIEKLELAINEYNKERERIYNKYLKKD